MDKIIKLSPYAKQYFICYITAYTLFNSGNIVGAFKTEAITIFIKQSELKINYR